MGDVISKSEGVSFPVDMRLKTVVVFFRHGARTPLTKIKAFDDISYDPNYHTDHTGDMDIPTRVIDLDGRIRSAKDEETRNRGMHLPGELTAGHLTTRGRKQALDFGRSLRVRYMKGLRMRTDVFVKGDVYLQAKNLNRTVESMRCVLAGMYGKEAFQGTVASIRVAKHEEDILDTNFRHANRTAPLVPKSLTSPPAYVQRIQTVQREASDVSVPIDHFDILNVRDHVTSAREHGLSTPLWAASASSAGALLNEVKGCLLSAIEDPNSPKMFLFACSDTTLRLMLKALECFDGHVPSFMADLAFELYEATRSGFWVRVLYKGKPQVIWTLKAPLVPLSQFCHVLEPSVSASQPPLDQYVTRCRILQSM